jgi:hypothetical protein
MENFREFDAGPDPFGRTYHVLFKWQQTGISIRHADTVDVQFLLKDGTAVQKRTVALPNAMLKARCSATGRDLNDGWCARLAAMHLRTVIETAEDFDKSLVTLTAAQIAEYDDAITKWETAEVKERRAS